MSIYSKTEAVNIPVIPEGWVKGERVTVEKLTVKGAKAWVVSLPPYSVEHSRGFANVAATWFYTDEDYITWMNWWFS